MVPKPDRVVSYHEGFLPIKSYNPLMGGLARSRDKLNLFYFHYQSNYSHQTYQYDSLLWWPRTHNVTWALYLVVLWGHVTNWNHYISTTRVSIAAKLGRMITYFDGLLPIKSFDPLITWPYEMTWQTKSIISPIPQCLWPPNLVGCWLILMECKLSNHLGLSSHGLAR